MIVYKVRYPLIRPGFNLHTQNKHMSAECSFYLTLDDITFWVQTAIVFQRSVSVKKQ